MLTDEEFQEFFINAFILIGILVFIGCIHTLCMHLRGRNVVEPAGKNAILVNTRRYLDFNSTFLNVIDVRWMSKQHCMLIGM